MNQIKEAFIGHADVDYDYVDNAHDSEVQLDNMQVACADNVDRTWVGSMEVNNDAIIYKDN